jgi:ubiquinone/menaquinone biosynthesis C-methylase UbiE
MTGLSERSRHDQEMHREVASMYRRRSTYPFAEAFQQERNDLILELAPPAARGRALDLGCGTGLLLSRLAARYQQTIGFDLSTEMLEGCERHGRARLVRGDMTSLPFASGSIAVVFCRSALHHVDDEIAVLNEVTRVLEPGGRLILAEPANDNPVARAARAWVKRRPSYGRLHTIDRAFTRAELRRLLDAAGLEVRRERRFGYLAYPLCDNPDLVPVLKILPFASALGAALRAVDRLLASIPVVRTQSWYTILEVARRGERTA